MPNTLAHIGVQLPLFKAANKNIDPRWIALGLMIPDIPWILQRAVMALFPQISTIDIRAYLLVMSTPFFCGLLCASIAFCFQKSRSIFWVLFIQSILHLILDSMQQKIGIKIPFLGPFSWAAYELPIFSMDGITTKLLTLSGLIVVILIAFKKIHFPKLSPFSKRPFSSIAAGILMLIYLASPLALYQSVIDANLHELKTWRESTNRTGKTVHFDRAIYHAETQRIEGPFNPEGTTIIGIDCHQNTSVSTTAKFIDNNTLSTTSFIAHPKGLRFSYVLIGLLGVIFIWIYPMILSFRPKIKLD